MMPDTLPPRERPDFARLLPMLLGGCAFLFLYAEPFTLLIRDWVRDPEAAHGLLLGPLAVLLIIRSGLAEDRRGQPVFGMLLIVSAILLRIVSALAAELFTMRMSMLAAAAGLVIFAWGARQLFRWWLPVCLLVLSVPIPSVILSTLALPLQLRASALGAILLEWRDVPVVLSGNIIQLPGRSLFVTEACSGLRSLTALLSLGLLVGGIWLKRPGLRLVLLLMTVPVAMVINGVRVFITGFFVYFVDESLGEGFMHLTEGWVMFVIAFAILGLITGAMGWIERRFTPSPATEASA